ncbi:uncharacterized protein PAN0_003d1706 [Moesziomyces antarcticus]|uniref:uncharacterized protein n=1 Tax=Pseudozyma antarctica TaxID=84753 RepID=UPI000719856C|nr:uncharacterized protein PAN0_003d1706 [Moesziomyces antarcticus]GAK63501.1 hypothetical protein PAN0_003d1706 [Moesziomyces antarcticus]
MSLVGCRKSQNVVAIRASKIHGLCPLAALAHTQREWSKRHAASSQPNGIIKPECTKGRFHRWSDRHLQRTHHLELASHELKHALGEPSFASYSQHQRGHGKPPVAAGWNGDTNDPPPPDRRAASTLSSSASQAALLLRRLPAHPIDPCAQCRRSKRGRLAAFCAHTACQLKKKGRADHSGRHGIMKKGVGGSEIAAGSTRHSHLFPPAPLASANTSILLPHYAGRTTTCLQCSPARIRSTFINAPLAHSLFAFSQPTLGAHKAMGGRGKPHCDFARNAMLQTRLTAASTRHSPLAALAHLLRSRGQLKPFFAAPRRPLKRPQSPGWSWHPTCISPSKTHALHVPRTHHRCFEKTSRLQLSWYH